MAKTTTEINIEPLTRIEGHMGIHAEADLEAGRYVDAHCYATMFRGLEEILKGREPADAIWLTQRTCGVCPTHTLPLRGCIHARRCPWHAAAAQRAKEGLFHPRRTPGRLSPSR